MMQTSFSFVIKTDEKIYKLWFLDKLCFPVHCLSLSDFLSSIRCAVEKVFMKRKKFHINFWQPVECLKHQTSHLLEFLLFVGINDHFHLFKRQERNANNAQTKVKFILQQKNTTKTDLPHNCIQEITTTDNKCTWKNKHHLLILFFLLFAFHQIPFSKSDGPTGKNKQPDQTNLSFNVKLSP